MASKVVFPVHAMKKYGGSGGLAPLILNVVAMWTGVVNIEL
jgi:hypothetical protein